MKTSGRIIVVDTKVEAVENKNNFQATFIADNKFVLSHGPSR